MEREHPATTAPADPGQGTPGRGGGASAGTAAAPHLAAGLELVGELHGSGYRDRQHLVRRADGQTFQLTPLLYEVLAAVDGERGPLQIAWQVAGATGRVLSADDVTYLLEEKLRPMGLLRAEDGSEPHVTRSSPLLGLRLKRAVTSPRVTELLTGAVLWLFHPFLVGAVIAGFGASVLWVFGQRGLGAALGDAIYQPSAVLLLVALTVASAAFHELGHAAACRYGGAKPGVMGAALYLIWPVFYTDVTDSYRLSRAGRLRTDLGGLYFNAVFALGTIGVWWLTRAEPLLLMVPVQLFQMVRQLVPLVRFDGYHILADLLGVPDLFARIKPTLAALLPSNWGRPENRALRPFARVVVTAWVLLVVPALAAFFVATGIALPKVALTAWDSFGVHLTRLRAAADAGNAIGVSLTALSLLMLLLPPLSMAYILGVVGRRLFRAGWRAGAGRPALQGGFAVATGALVLVAALAVWPDRPYAPTDADAARPVPTDGYAKLPGSPSGAELAALETAPDELPAADPDSRRVKKRRLVVVRAVGPEVTPPAAAADPQVAAPPVATVARSPWPFPFAPPGPVGEGSNRAMAVNTVDGATVTDMAVQLVWLSDEDILQINEAYALASCRSCTTTAAAFHVVFSRGPVSTAIPQNIAVAYNQECEACDTDAIAVQLVVTLIAEPTDEALAAIDAEWAEVEALQAASGTLSAAEIATRLGEHRNDLLRIVAPFTQLASGEPPTTTATPSASTEPTSTPSASTTTTSSPPTSTTSNTTTTSPPTSTTSPTTSTTSPPTTSTSAPTSTTTTEQQAPSPEESPSSSAESTSTSTAPPE